jgi:hypothetical protein
MVADYHLLLEYLITFPAECAAPLGRARNGSLVSRHGGSSSGLPGLTGLAAQEGTWAAEHGAASCLKPRPYHGAKCPYSYPSSTSTVVFFLALVNAVLRSHFLDGLSDMITCDRLLCQTCHPIR